MPSLMRSRCLAALLLALGAPGLASSQSTRELDDAVVRMSERGDLQHGMAPPTFTQPARLRHGLGAVLDVRQANRAGLQVLAVTPNAAADRLGLREGDRIRAINGHRLDGNAAPTPLLQAALDAGNGRLRVELDRGGNRLTLEGSADVVQIPAYRMTVAPSASLGCGHVSDDWGLTVSPRHIRVPGNRPQDISQARVLRINGRSTPMQRQARHRVPAGRIILLVDEQIESQWFPLSGTQVHQRARNTKPLVIDVQPGKRYQIAARRLVERITSDNVRRNDYWEPVMLSVRDEHCG